jgi:hypothetical protein
MRIQQIMLVPLAAFGLATGHALQDDGGADAALEARFGALEARLAQTEAYLQAQAKAAEALSAKLKEAEEAGFTSGINFRSREILVGAWRAQIKATTSGVPGAKTAAPAEKKQPVGD